MTDNTQDLYNLVAVLVKRLGGEVTVSREEQDNPPYGMVTSNGDGTITIKTV